MCPVCVLLCVACVSVWSWSALQFVLQDLKIALANTPSVHPLFVLYCIVYYKRERVCVCVCVLCSLPLPLALPQVVTFPLLCPLGPPDTRGGVRRWG